MAKSGAWKDFERAIAETARKFGFTQAHRVLRGDDIGESDIDVSIPEVPAARVDCKYRQGGWSHHKIFVECEKKYVTKGQFLVLPTKSGRQNGSISSVRTEVLFELLAAKYLSRRENPNSMGCPRCPGVCNVDILDIGLAQCVCLNCSLSYLVRQEELPKNLQSRPEINLTAAVVLEEVHLELQPIKRRKKSVKAA